jgi:predicted transcriptional regulator
MTKQELIAFIETLPEETAPESFDQMAAELQRISFMADVQAGLDEISRGELVSHEEIEEEMAAWLEE